MDIENHLLEHGAVNITDIKSILQGFAAADWAADSAFRNRLTGPRPGTSLVLCTNNDFSDQLRWQRELKQGYLSVYKRPTWNVLGECTQKLLDQIIKHHYPATDYVRVQYAVLPSGAQIPRHRDARILQYLHRLHVPIVTHEHVEFLVEEQTFQLQEGRLYELNNVREHAVKNNSPIDRVHLLVDLLRHQDARARYFDSYEAMQIAA